MEEAKTSVGFGETRLRKVHRLEDKHIHDVMQDNDDVNVDRVKLDHGGNESGEIKNRQC